MEKNEQQVLDGFAEQKGEAKYGLYRNAATAARYSHRNCWYLFVILVLMVFLVIENKWLTDEQEQTTGLKIQAAEHLAIISEQQKIINNLKMENENAGREIMGLRQTESRKKRVLLAYKFDDPTYLDGSRKVHEMKISPAKTIATLRGFKSDILTLKNDGKINLVEYITSNENSNLSKL